VGAVGEEVGEPEDRAGVGSGRANGRNGAFITEFVA
jgi:hypothetical protein